MTKPETTIRLSKPDDALEVLHLKDETWLATYPNEQHAITEADIASHLKKDAMADRLIKWRGYLNPSQTMKNWVAINNNKIIGFIAAGLGKTSNEIKALYVLPQYQRQGVGSQLLRTAMAWLGDQRDVFLEVTSYNEPAIAAYMKAGFVVASSSKADPFTLPSGAVMLQTKMVRKRRII